MRRNHDEVNSNKRKVFNWGLADSLRAESIIITAGKGKRIAALKVLEQQLNTVWRE